MLHPSRVIHPSRQPGLLASRLGSQQLNRRDTQSVREPLDRSEAGIAGLGFETPDVRVGEARPLRELLLREAGFLTKPSYVAGQGLVRVIVIVSSFIGHCRPLFSFVRALSGGRFWLVPRVPTRSKGG